MEIWWSKKFKIEIKNSTGGLTVKEKFSEIKDRSLENTWPETLKQKDEWYKIDY